MGLSMTLLDQILVGEDDYVEIALETGEISVILKGLPSPLMPGVPADFSFVSGEVPVGKAIIPVPEDDPIRIRAILASEEEARAYRSKFHGTTIIRVPGAWLAVCLEYSHHLI